ncbi:MAG: purine-nucleoside phosphorylase, partial [Clostridia bacterium]|nr:purine-nucleoside phosphorylase [Clostridia bacterium]
SSDIFYNANPDANKKWIDMGVLGVEMEAAALYMNAAYLGKRALAICTVSDHLLTGEALDANERQNSFTEMMEIALNTAIKM